MLLLEDLDLLAKTGAGKESAHRYKQWQLVRLSEGKRIEQAPGEDEGKQLTFRASGLGKA